MTLILVPQNRLQNRNGRFVFHLTEAVRQFVLQKRGLVAERIRNPIDWNILGFILFESKLILLYRSIEVKIRAHWKNGEKDEWQKKLSILLFSYSPLLILLSLCTLASLFACA